MPEGSINELIYEIWAPASGQWSPWAKPVLFSYMSGPRPAAAPSTAPAYFLDWVPPVEQNVAIILDLPGDEGVLLGLELARNGYRPVPLYNAVPGPTPTELQGASHEYFMSAPVVDVVPIRDALWNNTETLNRLSIPPDAPPVFLLDANRRTGRWSPPLPGNFDNRSVSFTTDFPSALFLQSHEISHAILVQPTGTQPQPDLAHTLRRWQDGGINIELKRLDLPGPALPCEIAKPSWYGAIWYRVAVALGLRKHALGGYGGIIGVSAGG